MSHWLQHNQLLWALTWTVGHHDCKCVQVNLPVENRDQPVLASFPFTQQPYEFAIEFHMVHIQVFPVMLTALELMTRKQ